MKIGLRQGYLVLYRHGRYLLLRWPRRGERFINGSVWSSGWNE